MKPEFSRGDVCIVKKIDEVEEIQQGDIIEYIYNNTSILHRVIKIEESITRKEFITKGDNNTMQDIYPVHEEQILGIVKYKIPYIGYPSVWLSELLLKQK